MTANDPELPVTVAVIDGRALGEVVARTYPLGLVQRSYLLRAAINHFYVVQTSRGRYAVRVSQARWRTEAETIFETAFQRHLMSQGCPVAAPILTNGGAAYHLIDGGARTLIVYPWVDGVALDRHLTPANARRFGTIIADLHHAAGSFAAGQRVALPIPRQLAEWFPTALGFLVDRDRDCALLRELTDQALRFARYEPGQALPVAAVHGDLHAGNALLGPDERATVLDFDFCGDGPLAYDLASYAWGNDQIGVEPNLTPYFLEGYEARRPLSSAERDAIPKYRVLKSLWWLALRAHLVDRLGSTMFDPASLDRYFARLRQDARAAKMTD